MYVTWHAHFPVYSRQPFPHCPWKESKILKWEEIMENKKHIINKQKKNSKSKQITSQFIGCSFIQQIFGEYFSAKHCPKHLGPAWWMRQTWPLPVDGGQSRGRGSPGRGRDSETSNDRKEYLVIWWGNAPASHNQGDCLDQLSLKRDSKAGHGI